MDFMTYDYIRGLIEREGSFTFSTNYSQERKVPAFSISMHIRDKNLLEEARNRLGLKNKVYSYDYSGKGRLGKGPMSFLIVREFLSLRNIIIPLCFNRLPGNKGRQFDQWLDKIEIDPMVSNRFKVLAYLRKHGFYEKLRGRFI